MQYKVIPTDNNGEKIPVKDKPMVGVHYYLVVGSTAIAIYYGVPLAIQIIVETFTKILS